MWGKLFLIGYAIVWILLILDCARRKRFYAIVGQGLPTKLLWIATFLLFSPLLTVLYAIFGLAKRPRDDPPKAARFAILALIAAVVAFKFMPFGHPGSRAFSLIRDAGTGEMVLQGDDGDSGVELNAAVTESKSNSNTISMTSSSSHARFACRHVALFNMSDHPLAARIGAELTTRMAKWPHVHRIDYYPCGEMPEIGQRLPDLILSLELDTIDETRLPAHHTIEAKFTLMAGQKFGPAPRTLSSDDAHPPVMQCHWKSNLEHRSTTTGLRSADARYAAATESIANEFAERLGKDVTKWIEKSGAMPQLPDTLYGTYHPTENVDFVNDYDVTHVLSGDACMVHNQTTWLFEEMRDRAETFRVLREQLVAAGWDVKPAPDEPDKEREITATQGARRLHVEATVRGGAFGIVPASRPEASVRHYLMDYRDPFTEEERTAALESLLDTNAPPDLVLAFAQMTHHPCGDEPPSPTLRDRMYTYVEAAGLDDPHAQLDVGRWHASHDRIDAARACLLQARTIAMADFTYSDIKDELKKLAEKIGEADLLERPLTLNELQQAGYRELTDGSETLEAEVPVGKPLMIYATPPESRENDPVIASALVERDPDPENVTGYKLSVILGDLEDGGHSKSTCSFQTGPGNHPFATNGTGYNDFSVRAEATELDNKNFQIKLSGSWD